MHKLIVAPLHYFYPALRDSFPNRVNLGNGYILQRFDSRVLENVFDFFNQSYTERDKEELRNCRYAIYYRYEVDNESHETPTEVVTEIHRIVYTLRLVKPTRVLPSIFHFRLIGRRKEAIQITYKPLTNITFPRRDSGSQHFNRRDAYKLRRYMRCVRLLYQNFGGSYHKVLNALFFFEIGHENHLYKPRLIHFVTSLESLFNTGNKEVNYSLKIRCAYFLERKAQHRLDITRLLKDIYNLRSLFVHGQASPQRILVNQADQERLLVSAEDIARRCLQKIFDKNLVTVFDNPSTLETEFQNLELGLPSSLR